MSTPTEEVTLDLEALDAAAGKTPPTPPEPAEITVETTPATDKTGISVDEGVEKLKTQLADERKRADEERNARLAAEARANEAAQGEADARATAQTSQLDQIKSAVAHTTQIKDVLKTKYAEAAAAGDWGAAGEIQSQMADAAAELLTLKRAQSALEKAPKPTPRAPTDPVEKFAADLSPASAAWVRAHPEYVRDQAKNRKMIAAHNIALADGNEPDSPGYFKSIEYTLKIAPIVVRPPEDPPADDPMRDAARPVNGGGRQAAPVAPVSRTPASNSGQRPNTIRLTPDQVEAAHASFPDSKDPLGDYAKQLLALRKEGRIQ